MSELSETLKLVEYRVVPITRFQVLRYEEGGDDRAGSSSHGTFDNQETAYEVGYALTSAEHKRLGWPIGDDRMQYPKGDPRYPESVVGPAA